MSVDKMALNKRAGQEEGWWEDREDGGRDENILFRVRVDSPAVLQILHQTTNSHQIAFFQVLDLYRRSPKSGDVCCEARRLKKTICNLSCPGGLPRVCFLGISEKHETSSDPAPNTDRVQVLPQTPMSRGLKSLGFPLSLKLTEAPLLL